MRRIILPILAVLLVAVPSIITSAPHRAASGSTPTNWDPSGQAMPVGDLPGWHQIFADNFANDSYQLGSFTGCTMHGCSGTPSVPWGAVPDGHPDTSGHCVYEPSKTVSITGGVMNIFLHTDPNGTCMDSSLYPLAPNLRYGMYSVRFRADAVTGYKGVFLLWPVDHVHGEIDFPEANLDAQLHGFLHTVAGGAQFQRFVSNASWTSWHTATLEWTPSKVTFILDGTSLGSTSLDVPQTPMTLALRGESELEGAPKPPASAHGDLQIDWATMYTYAPTTPQPPAVILRNDDAGRIYRIMQDGTPVTVEFNVQNQYFPKGKTSYVTVAEIPGTDKGDEVVMLGGHLDSWTSATGATDNAIGCAIMMEAARILEAVGAKPRRTIRVALWSGEEEGLLGSFAYVKNHFGSAEEPTKDFDKLDAYWNIDDGTGRVRGASIFGPPADAEILAQYLQPFEDWGVFGAAASTARVEGGSDNGAFAVAGLPGIGTQQDGIEYNSTTWHTDLDNYERIVPEDVMHNAVLTAAVVLGLANRDQMLPRFAKDSMPAVPVPRSRGGQ